MPYPVYSSQTKDNGLMGYYEDYLYENAITWTTDGANAGTVNFRHGKFYCTNVCGVLLANNATPNQAIAEILNNAAKSYVSYVGNPKLMNNVMAEIAITLPKKKEEQRKVSNFLGKIDNIIILYQYKYDKLINIKQSMLERMFPRDGRDVPEIRFAGFSEPWERRKLKDIAEKVTAKNTDLTVRETFTNSAEYGIISQRDFFDHDISNVENIGGYYVVKSDDFVYNPRISVTAPVGPINRNRLGRNGIMSPLYTVFRTHDVDTTYLEWFFKSGYWHSYMRYNGDSGARSDRFSIKDSVFFEMPIPYPNIKEQYRIGVWMNNLDNLFALYYQKIEKLKQVKQSMLQKMFV